MDLPSHDPLQDLSVQDMHGEDGVVYMVPDEDPMQLLYERAMYAKMNEEYCIKENVDIRFSLSPDFVKHLFMYRRGVKTAPDGKKVKLDKQLFNIIVSKPQDWTDLGKSGQSMRLIVYSICRNIIMGDRRTIVKGRWHSVLCLLNLMYDSLFMSEEQLYPSDHEFPDTLPYRNPEVMYQSYSSFRLHDFDVKFTLSRTKSYTLSVKFDLWVLKRALGPSHIASQRRNVTRVPLPTILSTIFPEHRKAIQPFTRPATAGFSIKSEELDQVLNCRAEQLAAAPLDQSETEEGPATSKGPTKRKLGHGRGVRQKRLRLQSETSEMADGLRSARSNTFNHVVTADGQTESETSDLYLEISTQDHVDQETGYLTRWALWYCPYNGQLHREPVPSINRPDVSCHVGGVLLNVPVSKRAALVAEMVERTAQKHPLTSVPDDPFSNPLFWRARIMHIVPASASEGALDPSTNGEEEDQALDPSTSSEDQDQTSGTSSEEEEGQTSGTSSEEEDEDDDLLSSSEEDLDHGPQVPAQPMGTGKLIDLMMEMVENNATVVVCHPASKLAWIGELSKNPNLQVVPITKHLTPTMAQMASFSTVFVITYNQCATWSMDPSVTFQPLSCVWHRAVFDDTHLLQNSSCLRGHVPYSLEAGVRWCFASTGQKPLDALCSGLNFWAQLSLFTSKSMALNWHAMPRLLNQVAYPCKNISMPLSRRSDGTGVALIRAKMTGFGQAQYEVVHRESNMCVTATGEPWITATSEAMRRSLVKKSQQTGMTRLKKKQELLSEAHNVDIACLSGKTLDDEEVCSICFEDLGMNETVQLMQCGHKLCVECQTTCAQRKLVNCPICRKRNTLSQRKLLVDAKFDKRKTFNQATNKCSLLSKMIPTHGVLAVVYHSPATAKFLQQYLVCEGHDVVNYGSLSSAFAFKRFQRMKAGVLLISSRLTRHSLQLSPVVAVAFFEPSLDHGSEPTPSSVYATNWSCDQTAKKAVLYTGKTLEETAVRYGRRAVKVKQRPQIIMQKQGAGTAKKTEQEAADMRASLVAAARASTV